MASASVNPLQQLGGSVGTALLNTIAAGTAAQYVASHISPATLVTAGPAEGSHPVAAPPCSANWHVQLLGDSADDADLSGKRARVRAVRPPVRDHDQARVDGSRPRKARSANSSAVRSWNGTPPSR